MVLKIRYNTDSKDGKLQWRVFTDSTFTKETLVDDFYADKCDAHSTIDQTPNGKKGHVTIICKKYIIKDNVLLAS